MLLLATRPQNYESLSLTNSTEFGQHSLSSSVELIGGQANHILNSHNRSNILTGQKPNSTNVSSNFLANQMRSSSKEKDGRPFQEDKDWKLPYQNNNTILEDLKEEDVSFALSNLQKSNSRIYGSSQNDSKTKIDKQCSGTNNSSEAGRESQPKSDLSGNGIHK